MKYFIIKPFILILVQNGRFRNHETYQSLRVAIFVSTTTNHIYLSLPPASSSSLTLSIYSHHMNSISLSITTDIKETYARVI